MADRHSDHEIVLTEIAGGVATVRLVLPTLTDAAKEQLLESLRQVVADPDVRVVVLTGTGRVFCAGQDLAEHAASLRSGSGTTLDTVLVHYNPIVTALTQAPMPIIAAINGACAGAGLALALACDVRVCSTAAKFSVAFTGVGLTFDSGMSATLARAVGAARASELVLLNEPFTATQAHAWGIVGRLVAPDAVLTESLTLAQRLAAGPTLAYAAAKRALMDAATASLADVLHAEYVAQTELGATADHREAVEAFLAKRNPTFHGC